MIKIKGYEKLEGKKISTDWNEYLIHLEQKQPYENSKEKFSIYGFTLRGITTPTNLRGLLTIKDKLMGTIMADISLTSGSRTQNVQFDVELLRSMDTFLHIVTQTAWKVEQKTSTLT